MPDYESALWIPNGHFFPNRYGHRPTYVILHGTAGGSSAQNIATYFANSGVEVSAHYVVGQDGVVVQCIAEADGAWANGPITNGADPWWSIALNPNLITISIEHVKPSTDNSDALTPAQQESSFKLVAAICERWHIPKRTADEQGGITGHFSMDPVNRARCPGNYPWDALWSYLQGAGMIDVDNPAVAAYFQKLSDTNWLCKKTKANIGGAILKFYKSLGGYGLAGLTILGLPLADEYNDTDKTHVSKQRFERGIVVFDPEHQIDSPPGAADCYLQHVEQLYPLPQQVADLQNTVNVDALQAGQLKNQIDDLTDQLDLAKQRIIDLTNATSGTTVEALSKVLSQVLVLEQSVKTLLPP